MRDVTPTRSVFDDAYRSGTPPWVIDGDPGARRELGASSETDDTPSSSAASGRRGDRWRRGGCPV